MSSLPNNVTYMFSFVVCRRWLPLPEISFDFPALSVTRMRKRVSHLRQLAMAKPLGQNTSRTCKSARRCHSPRFCRFNPPCNCICYRGGRNATSTFPPFPNKIYFLTVGSKVKDTASCTPALHLSPGAQMHGTSCYVNFWKMSNSCTLFVVIHLQQHATVSAPPSLRPLPANDICGRS